MTMTMTTTQGKFQQRHYIEMVKLVGQIKAEAKFDSKYQGDGNYQVSVKALEDYLSLFFAADNPKFDLTKWRKALGRSDY
jgi:hypothetical protein